MNMSPHIACGRPGGSGICIWPFLCLVLFVACNRPAPVKFAPSSADSAALLRDLEEYRTAADEFFRNDPASPFKRDSSIAFTGIQWYRPDVGFVFKSKLYRFDNPDTVTILGTKGEERRHVKFGFFLIRISGMDVPLNVYKYLPDDARRRGIGEGHLSLWFTDETTGKETYQVGRYLDIEEEQSDPEHLYTLDFNRSYNPYCAYTPAYSCAIPTRDDRLPVSITAGERMYHH
jgi:uncharacterized protein (DUF1684 family)